MRRLLRKVCFAWTMTTIAAFGADNSLGRWKLNVEKSEYTPAPFLIKSLITTREAADDGIKMTSTGEKTDGTVINSTYTAKYDGRDYPVTGSVLGTIAIRQLNANTFVAETKTADGKCHATVRMAVSRNGNTMTTLVIGNNADGVAISATLVYEKQ
jgi:hypothetical protein